MTHAPHPKPSFKTDPKKWSATLNTQPIAPPRLHVQGSVAFHTAGWTCTLTQAQFPSLNPKYYGVEIRYEPPAEGSADVETTSPLTFDKEFRPDQIGEYTHVDVRPVNNPGYENVSPFLVKIEVLS